MNRQGIINVFNASKKKAVFAVFLLLIALGVITLILFWFNRDKDTSRQEPEKNTPSLQETNDNSVKDSVGQPISNEGNQDQGVKADENQPGSDYSNVKGGVFDDR